MTTSSSSYEVKRQQDLIKVDVQLRDTKDLLITCPPFSGLSVFLQQIQKHISLADHFSNYISLLFDCETQNHSNNLIDSIEVFLETETGFKQPYKSGKNRERSKLIDIFTEIGKQNERQKNVFIIDNLEKISGKESIGLLESVRVIAESRYKIPYLRNVIFVLAGHSLDLRKLDPKHSSPFNTATQIYLDDLPSEDSVAVIKEALLGKKYFPLIPEYIDFLTYGHPYLIDQICYYLRNEEIKYDSSKGVTFELVDSIADRISSEQREEVFRYVDHTLKNLSPASSNILQKLLNGVFFKSVKFSDSLTELRLLGLINNSRENRWHIRNHLFSSYIRQHADWTGVSRKNNFVPRRLFVNVEGYKILFDLENNLREFVVSQLFDAFGQDWGKTIESNTNLNKVVVKWKKLKKDDLSISWLTHDDLPNLCYALFPEIREIIDVYWGGMFEKYFQPKSIFEGSFESLEVLRNKIAHNRPLSDHDIELLISTAKQFNECMYENRPS